MAEKVALLGSTVSDPVTSPMEARHILDALLAGSNPEITAGGKKIMTILQTSQVDKLF